MVQNEAHVSRYAVVCPACNMRFRPGRQGSMGETTFTCPNCGALLEYAPGHEWLVLPVRIVAAAAIAFDLRYRGLALVLITICISIFLFVLGISFSYHIWPPKARRRIKPGYSSLHLTD